MKAAIDPLDNSMARNRRASPESYFSSDRERRLWGWTLAIVVAIYSTLSLASSLATALPQSLAAVGFLGAMLLVVLTVLAQGLAVRPRGAEITVALGVAVVYFMVFFRMAIPERSHLIEYGVVAVFIYEALTERASHGRPVRVPAVLAILATALLGALDECIQLFVPGRGFELSDICFNALAGVLAVAASVALGWNRRRNQ